MNIDRLSFGYCSAREQRNVLQELNLQVDKGEIVGVIGPSGSGKSSLLRLIAGLERPFGGRIIIDGRVMVSEQAFIEAEHRGVGMVFQNYALFPHLTVAKNIMFGLHQYKRQEKRARLVHMLELVQLADLGGRYPHQLSGGQQQRVALARALAPGPKLLLMDEPFSSLDAHLRGEIRTELAAILRKADMTCLFVSHDRADTEAICDRTIELTTGV